jgi:predicted sulfurtransferase
MKYSTTLDKILAAIEFQVEGKHEQAARFFGSAAKSSDIKTVIASLDRANKKAFDSLQVASTKPESLATLLQKASLKQKVTSKEVKASDEEKMSDDDMDGILDDMTASEEDDISIEDLDDATDDGVEELPEASTDMDEEDTDEEDPVEAKKSVAKVTANLAALDRLKSVRKAK